MKSNDPPSYGEKTFPDNVCVCARVYMCVCGVWGLGGGAPKVGGGKLRSRFLTCRGSGTDNYNKSSMFTKNICKGQNYLVLCMFSYYREVNPSLS